jgi:hypothetical protein
LRDVKDTVHHVKSTVKNLDRLMSTATQAASFVSFASAVLPICTITTTVSGVYAQAKLLELGQEISDELKKVTEAAHVANNVQHQAHFAQHVYDFATSRTRAAKEERSKRKFPGSDIFFIYHPGTDWHASFEALQAKRPIPSLVGWTHSLDLIGRYASEIRQAIGPETRIHILMPSAHLYLIPDDFKLDRAMSPCVFEGELAYTAMPYVHVNIPKLDESHFHQIGRLPQKKVEEKPASNKAVRGLLSASVAVPAGIVGGAVLCPVAGVPLVLGAALAPGVVMGTVIAMGAELGVEKLYDDRHRKE